MTDSNYWPLSATGPILLRLSDHCDRWAIGRTTAYGDIAAGFYTAYKKGKSVLIDQVSARAHFAALPKITYVTAKPAPAPEPTAVESPPVKRRPGRPKGSKNKPKPSLPTDLTVLDAG